MSKYYKIPFSFQAILTRAPRETYCCSLQDSISQNISLIISSRFNELRYDPAYGCKIWEVDFIVPTNVNIWKEEIKDALEEAILRYEHRLDKILDFRIDVDNAPQHQQRINQVLTFQIRGSIKGTSEEVLFSDRLFFSPYSR